MQQIFSHLHLRCGLLLQPMQILIIDTMKTNSTSIFSALAFALLVWTYAPEHAEAQTKSLLPYGYGHTLEMSAGPAGIVNGLRPGMSKGYSAGGFDFNMRYSYFFGRHFGAYVGINVSEFSLGTDKLFGGLDGSYIYKSTKSVSGLNESEGGISVGGVYRYDFGRFSLRPRIGIGYIGYSSTDYHYYKFRTDRPDKDPEHIYVSGSSKAFMSIEASLQLMLSVSRHFFFSLEAGGRALPGRYSVESTVYDTRTRAPETWKQALLETNLDRHIDTALMSKETDRIPLGGTLYARIGLGWNIGVNRNARK